MTVPAREASGQNSAYRPSRWHANRGRKPGATRAGQSSSGRKMCAAVQALQIGVAASRSPSGSGSLAIGVEALGLVHPLVGRFDHDEPAERAATDPVVGEAVGLVLGRCDGQLDGHSARSRILGRASMRTSGDRTVTVVAEP